MLGFCWSPGLSSLGFHQRFSLVAAVEQLSYISFSNQGFEVEVFSF